MSEKGHAGGLAAPPAIRPTEGRGLGGLKALPLERSGDVRTYAGSSRTPIIIVSYNGPQSQQSREWRKQPDS